jgi:hypothetical protein
MPDESTLDPKPETTVNPQPLVVLGRMQIADVRAELSDERVTFGRLDYFDPDLLALAMKGKVTP